MGACYFVSRMKYALGFSVSLLHFDLRLIHDLPHDASIDPSTISPTLTHESITTSPSPCSPISSISRPYRMLKSFLSASSSTTRTRVLYSSIFFLAHPVLNDQWKTDNDCSALPPKRRSLVELTRGTSKKNYRNNRPELIHPRRIGDIL